MTRLPAPARTDPGPVPSAAPAAASALFLREPELRRGIELLQLASGQLARAVDDGLAAHGLGRAHHRALYWIARKPDLSVTELLQLLAITKQSLGRVLTELTARRLIEARPGTTDRRQRLLRLTAAGHALEATLFDLLRERLSAAYGSAGQAAVGGFWAVLEGLIPPAALQQIAAKRG